MPEEQYCPEQEETTESEDKDKVKLSPLYPPPPCVAWIIHIWVSNKSDSRVRMFIINLNKCSISRVFLTCCVPYFSPGMFHFAGKFGHRKNTNVIDTLLLLVAVSSRSDFDSYFPQLSQRTSPLRTFKNSDVQRLILSSRSV